MITCRKRGHSEDQKNPEQFPRKAVCSPLIIGLQHHFAQDDSAAFGAGSEFLDAGREGAVLGFKVLNEHREVAGEFELPFIDDLTRGGHDH